MGSNINWIDLARDLEESCEHGKEPPCSIKLLGNSSLVAQLAASKESQLHDCLMCIFQHGSLV
jgi:hypothetical protein